LEAEEAAAEAERKRLELEERLANAEKERIALEQKVAEAKNQREQLEANVEENKIRLEAEAEKEQAEKDRLVEEELLRQIEAEEKRKAEEELRLQEEAEAKRKAEEELRLQEEAEAKRKAEEELRLQEEAEAKRKAEKSEKKIAADGREIIDRDAEPNKDFTDYTSKYDVELIEDVFKNNVDNSEQSNKNASVRNNETESGSGRLEPNIVKVEYVDLKSTMDTKESEKQNPVEYVDETDSKQSKDAKQENVAFRIHAVPNEYSGFFDFSQEAYVDHKVTKKIKYAQDLDIEPFEQRISYIKEEKPRRKAPLIAFIVIYNIK